VVNGPWIFDAHLAWHALSITPTVESVNALVYLFQCHQDPVGGEEASAEIAGKSHDATVVLVTSVEPRHKVKSIDEDDAHERGLP